jgi:hypothetical protein
VAALFALYAAQWLAVVGFLPTQLAAAGLPLPAVALGGAAVAAANVAGNLAAGRALAHGVAPARLLALGFVSIAVCAVAAYGPGWWPGTGVSPQAGLPPAGRLAALALLSAVGGVVPATLFALAVRVAPGPDTLASTVGWMQQGSALGQFLGPPAVAAVAAAAGGWHLGWMVMAACAALALALLPALTRLLARRDAAGATAAG